jgi:hypothetical protein
VLVAGIGDKGGEAGNVVKIGTAVRATAPLARDAHALKRGAVGCGISSAAGGGGRRRTVKRLG